MDVSEVHKTKGKICMYTLKLAGDDTHDFYIAVGMSQDLEKRMLQHTGAAPGGSQWTALHPPTEILSIQIHETVEQAFACEAALWNLWAGILKDHSRVRGGRYNSVLPLKYPPPEGGSLKIPPIIKDGKFRSCWRKQDLWVLETSSEPD